MSDTTQSLIPYEDMLKAGMHFGRKRTVFSPRMKDHVYAVRDGICIIDLLKTQESLEQAITFLKDALAVDGGLVLFVAPTKQSQESVKEMAVQLGMPYVDERWIGGTLTNFKVINGRVKRLMDLEDEKARGAWEKYTKKERVVKEKELAKMQQNFDGLKRLTRMPDAIFVSSLREGAIAVHEANKMGVPVVAIGNTDSNPDDVAHVVCANDRSKKSVDLIVHAMQDALTSGK
jgi:small subunit ribosomal protein S2